MLGGLFSWLVLLVVSLKAWFGCCGIEAHGATFVCVLR